MGYLKRLLIVDDEETLTFSLYQVFIKAPIDCEVITASSGEEAYEKFQEQPFDLVITDISMPGMNGLALLKVLKAEAPGTKVIVITAYGSPEREAEANALGADRYIEKPFDIHDVKNVVIKMLE